MVVDFTNDLKKQGLSVKEALVKATQERFRSILITTIASWAWVLIGGLTNFMLLALIIVLVIYYIVDRILEKLGRNNKEEIELDDSPMIQQEELVKLEEAVM